MIHDLLVFGAGVVVAAYGFGLWLLPRQSSAAWMVDIPSPWRLRDRALELAIRVDPLGALDLAHEFFDFLSAANAASDAAVLDNRAEDQREEAPR